MKISKSTQAIVVITLIVIGVGVGVVWYLQHRKQLGEHVKIGTGTEGGTFYLIGKQLANSLNEEGADSRSFEARTTQGGVENVDLLLDGDVDLALVGSHVLESRLRTNEQLNKQIEIVARLYPTFVQVVVTKEIYEKLGDDKSIQSLKGIHDESRFGHALNMFIGGPQSGTRIVANTLLTELKIKEGREYTVDQSTTTYGDAAAGLGETIDAAIFVAGPPTEAVRTALDEGNCRLLNINDASDEIEGYTYEAEQGQIRTMRSDVLLVCRNDFDSQTVHLVLDSLFDNLNHLLLAHTTARDVRLGTVFEFLPPGFTLHAGVEDFKQEEEDKLLILAGPLGGKYYKQGRRIQQLLRERGIRSRVAQTRGTIENLSRLAADRPSLAIVQFDAALASLWDLPRAVYKGRPQAELRLSGWKIPAVKAMRRLVTLHKESLYVFSSDPDVTELSDLEGKRVCLGPEDSGTQLLAQAVLSQTEQGNGRGVEATNPIHLSVRDMVREMLGGRLKFGFAVSGVDSDLLYPLLRDDSIALLPIPADAINRLTPTLQHGELLRRTSARAALKSDDRNVKDGQREVESSPERAGAASRATAGEDLARATDDLRQVIESAQIPVRSIPAIQTQAVLVANESVEDVYRITEAIFSGAELLEADTKTLASSVPIPLHGEAADYYVDAKLVPKPENFDLIGAVKNALYVVLGLSSLATIVVAVRYGFATNAILKRILGVKLSAKNPDSVSELLGIRQEIRNRAMNRWWKPKRLSAARWRSLDELVDRRIEIAMRSLTGHFVREIREIETVSKPDEVTRRSKEIKTRIGEFLEAGELDVGQYEFLTRLVNETEHSPEAKCQTGSRDTETETQEALSENVSPEVLRQLFSALKSEDIGVTRKATRALMGLRKESSLVSVLLEEAVGDDLFSQTIALVLLAGAGQVGVDQISKELLSNDNFEIRKAAAWTLLEIMRSGSDVEIATAIPSLIQVAQTDPRASVRKVAIEVLSEIEPRTKDIAAVLKAAAHDKSKGIRKFASASVRGDLHP